MSVKLISINWVAKLNGSKDLDKYGDRGDIDLSLDNYTFRPDKAIFVPDFLMKTWERSDPPLIILYNTLHSKQVKR